MPKRTHEAAMLTKRQILQAALRLFTDEGYEKTSLSDIAREAGVTRGAIYWHFEDKGELLCELCKDLAERNELMVYLVRASRPEESDPLGCIKQWMLAHSKENASIMFSSALARMVRAILMGHVGSQDVRERLRDLIAERNQLLKEAVQNAINHRQLPLETKPEEICFVLTMVLSGYCNKDNAVYPLPDSENCFRTFVDVLISRLPDMQRQVTSNREHLHSRLSAYF